MIIGFIVWEAKGAKYPMFPSRLQQAPRILGLTLVITFISGANFFSIIMFVSIILLRVCLALHFTDDVTSSGLLKPLTSTAMTLFR